MNPKLNLKIRLPSYGTRRKAKRDASENEEVEREREREKEENEPPPSRIRDPTKHIADIEKGDRTQSLSKSEEERRGQVEKGSNQGG